MQRTRELQVQKKKQDFDHEFVQREWSQKIVGPESGEDPALATRPSWVKSHDDMAKCISKLC
jgi:hypothetical protein